MALMSLVHAAPHDLRAPLASVASHSWVPALIVSRLELVSPMILSARRTLGLSAGGFAVNTGLYYVYLHCRAVALFWKLDGWSRGF